MSNNAPTLEPIPPQDTSTQIALHGPPLLLTSIIAGLISLSALVLFAIAVPTRYAVLFEDAREGAEALRTLALSPTAVAVYNLTLEILVTIICLVLGLLIVVRRRNDGVGLFMVTMLILYGATSSLTIRSLAAEDMRWVVPENIVRAFNYILNLVILYIFPDGRFVPKWTRWLAVLRVIWEITFFVLFVNAPFNPYKWSLGIGAFLDLSWYLTGLYAQIYRYRKVSSPAQRQQTKWVIYGVAISIVFGVAAFYAQAAALTDDLPELTRPIVLLVGNTIYLISLLLLPLTISVSILRYRLWDIDFLINRSIIYGLLTLILGAVFVASSLGLQQVFAVATGGSQSPMALAASTVVIGVVFNPTRSRLQHFVDRRFYGIGIEYDRPRAVLQHGASHSGQTINTNADRYEVLEPLGQGGMAEVYKGKGVSLNRTVAIKMLNAGMKSNEEFRRRFEREARVLGALKHPNIVEMVDFGKMDDTYYLIMEYIAGPDLSEVLRTKGGLPLDEMFRLIEGIASALDYAHSRGIVHRDIKPSNVMIQPANGTPEHPVLTDFGIARMSDATQLTQTGMMGTLDYIAPEQIRSADDIDGRADIYALGVMAYQMATGQLPFVAPHPAALLLAHLNQPAPNPRTLRPDLPVNAAYAIQRALAKDPAQRFRTAGTFAAELTAD